MRYFDRAAAFAECCLEFGVLNHASRNSASLLQAIFLEYARYLLTLGLHRGFRHYCNRAGEKGKQLLQQYFKHGNAVLSKHSNHATLIDL